MKVAKSMVSHLTFHIKLIYFHLCFIVIYLFLLIFLLLLFDFCTYENKCLVVEDQFPSDTALGAKRHQDKIQFEKLQKHQGAHQQHQKTSQISKAQLNSKTTLKGTFH